METTKMEDDQNGRQKDEEMELSTTAGKEVVDVTFAVEDDKENSIAVVFDQEFGGVKDVRRERYT